MTSDGEEYKNIVLISSGSKQEQKEEQTPTSINIETENSNIVKIIMIGNVR